ncbi:hypothetical protein DK59_3071 [Brucella abortus bv. 4 str. 292]|nr:hypothetical protein DK59_3071 [Brucella abortus bv. 4 str. 292]
MTITRMSGSSTRLSADAASFWRTSMFTAFNASGRLSSRRATPSAGRVSITTSVASLILFPMPSHIVPDVEPPVMELNFILC